MTLLPIDATLAILQDGAGRPLATLLASEHNGVPVIDIVAQPTCEVHIAKFGRQAVICGGPSTPIQ